MLAVRMGRRRRNQKIRRDNLYEIVRALNGICDDGGEAATEMINS